MPDPVVPSREDPVVAALSEVAGGRAGHRVGAGRHGWWTPARVLVVASVVLVALAALTRSHCRGTLWASPDQFVHACYSDVPAVFAGSALAAGGLPYAADGAVGQPVGSGVLLWLLGLAVPDGTAQLRGVFDLAVVLVAVAVAAAVVCTVQLAGRRPWDAAPMALSPVIVVAGVVSLDAVAVALAAGALLAWSRRHPALAGALVGAAVSVRPVAGCVLFALVVLSVRAGTPRPAVRAAATATGVWLLVNLPVALLAGGGWSRWWVTSTSGAAGYGSPWLLPQLAGSGLPTGVVRWGSALAVLVALTVWAAWVLRARRRPRVPVAVLVLLVAVGVVLPVLPVQASLLLLPFAALALPGWRDHAVWAAVEVTYVTGTWLYLYGLSVPDRALPASGYAVLLLARLAAWAWLAWRAVALTAAPSIDPVRLPPDAPGAGCDDPAGGPLQDAARHRGRVDGDEAARPVADFRTGPAAG